MEGDPVLVGLVDKYVDAVLLDEKDGETYVVRASRANVYQEGTFTFRAAVKTKES